MVVGLILRLTAVASVRDSVSFDYQMFFNLLLPPIILSAGYELHQVCHLQLPLPCYQLTNKGKLLQAHWRHSDLCFCRYIHISSRARPHIVSLD